MHIITTFNKIVCSCYDYVVKATDYEFSKPVEKIGVHLVTKIHTFNIFLMLNLWTRGNPALVIVATLNTVLSNPLLP